MSETIVVPSLRLGKMHPKFDNRTLRMSRYLETRKRPKIPMTHTLSKKTLLAFPDLGQMMNDRLGCCTIAGIGHSFQGWSVYGKSPWRPEDVDIVAAYNAINGGTDNGAFMLDALNHARRVGVGGNRIYAYVAIDPRNRAQVRTGHFLFGGLYFGAGLPVNAQGQKIWDLVPGNGSEPWSWGGHAMNVFDYGKLGLTVVTWGQLQKVTWAWWDRYVDECYAILEEDYVGSDRRSPQGFSLKKLAEDLRAIVSIG